MKHESPSVSIFKDCERMAERQSASTPNQPALRAVSTGKMRDTNGNRKSQRPTASLAAYSKSVTVTRACVIPNLENTAPIDMHLGKHVNQRHLISHGSSSAADRGISILPDVGIRMQMQTGASVIS